MNQKVYPYCGIVASLIITFGCVITALLFPLNVGEIYSPINYFISELGQLGMSYGAIIFNLSLIIGGIFFFPFMIGLGKYLETKLSKIATFFGVISAFGAIGVGCFPMNYLTSHINAANTFFMGGLFAITIFSISTIRQKPKKLDAIVILFGFIVMIIFIIYIIASIIVFQGLTEAEIYSRFSPRPAFIWTSIQEWSVLISVLVWVVVVSIFWLRRLNEKRIQ